MTAQLLAILGQGLADPGTAALSVDDLGLIRGDGCFEGCRVVTSDAGVSAVSKLERHLARLARSAAAMEIAFDEPAWTDLVATACAGWSTPGEAAMRLLLTRGAAGSGTPSGLLTISALAPQFLRQRRDGIKVVTLPRGTPSDAFADAPWLLGGVKTLSYAINMAAQREAERRGCDDALFVSTDGWVLESPTSSVVWAVGRTLHTPPPGANGILASTTQELLFDRAAAAGWQTVFSAARVANLHAADVVWLVSSTRGPVEVIDIDGRARARNRDIDTEIRLLVGFAS